MTTMEAPSARFDIARVVQRTFDVVGRNFVPFCLMFLIPIGIFVVLGLVLGIGLGVSGALGRAPGTTPPLLPLYILIGVVAVVVGIVVQVIVQAGVTIKALNFLNGQPTGVGDALRAGSRVALPLIGLLLLGGLAIAVGFMLFIVPGVFLALLWAVIFPVEVVERKGVFGSFERSADLTRGSRWSIFLLYLAVVVAYVVARLLVLGLAAILGPVAALVSLVFAIVVGVISAVGTVSIYYELRLIKEGVAPQALVQVFA